MRASAFFAAISGAIGLWGCLFSGGGARSGGGWDEFPNPLANTCGDITPTEMRRADSLVAQARPFADGEAAFFLGDSAQTWDEVKRRDVGRLQALYGEAVRSAPGHCGALFGQAVATALSVVGDGGLDSLVREASGLEVSAGALLKRSVAGADADGAAAGAAGLMLEARAGLARADKSVLLLAQEVSGRALLKLDTSIAALEKVAANRKFQFKLGDGSRSWNLDRGEGAPLLGGLKILKALLTVVAGYTWQAEADGDYPYWSVLQDLRTPDFDSLTDMQVKALDHYRDLFRRGHAFTRIKDGWRERVAAIPSLLDEAVVHAQAGLDHGIYQAEQNLDQRLDPYRVGTGEDADVDPAEVRLGIERLGRARKYLRGEVPLVFGKGEDTLRVDFPRLFRLDGLQNLLPYFDFHPYVEWNDTLPADTSRPGVRLRGPVYFQDPAGNRTLAGSDLGLYLDDLAGLSGKVVFPDPTFGGVFPGLSNGNFWATAQSLRGAGPRRARECGPSPQGCRSAVPAGASDLDLLVYYLAGFGL